MCHLGAAGAQTTKETMLGGGGEQRWPFPQRQLVKPECTSLPAHRVVAHFKPTYK